MISKLPRQNLSLALVGTFHNCRFWGPANSLPDRSCKAVVGDISPAGWCSIWLPPDGAQPFAWPKQLISGDW